MKCFKYDQDIFNGLQPLCSEDPVIFHATMVDAHTKLFQCLLTRELKSGLVSVTLGRKNKQCSGVRREWRESFVFGVLLRDVQKPGITLDPTAGVFLCSRPRADSRTGDLMT